MQSCRLPRVLAIHDLCVFGRCSLSVIGSVLAARGAQCCPLPTALLSTPTNYEGNTLFDLSGELPDILRHLCAIGTCFDAVYSGFLATTGQAALVETAFEMAPEALRVVDPVLGDNGKLYRTMDASMISAVRSLAEKAHLITPNVTEASVLLGGDPNHFPADENEARSWLEALSLNGSRSVVLTGLSFVNPDEITVGWTEHGAYGFTSHPRSGGSYPGTGDLFTAYLLSERLNGVSLAYATAAAARFVSRCAALTVERGTPPEEGLLFEEMLRKH